MSIKSKIEKLEHEQRASTEPPLTPAELERAKANWANAYYILSTMEPAHADYLARKILERDRLNPLVAAFYKLQALMLSEQLRQVEQRVYAIPPAIAEQYLAREDHTRTPNSSSYRDIPTPCDVQIAG
jgi:hypothetical protein